MAIFIDQPIDCAFQRTGRQLDLFTVVHTLDPVFHLRGNFLIEFGEEVRIGIDDVLITGQITVFDQVNEIDQLVEKLI
ncbi:hypothetical protein D3C76_870600 [compost metagenome]